MLSKVQKYIHSISSTAHLEALQEACQLFEKEREQWKQERLAFLFDEGSRSIEQYRGRT